MKRHGRLRGERGDAEEGFAGVVHEGTRDARHLFDERGVGGEDERAESARGARARAVVEEVGEDGDEVGEGLAGSRLGGDDDVGAGLHRGDGAGLDAGGAVESET